jgi:hypothetical protein
VVPSRPAKKGASPLVTVIAGATAFVVGIGIVAMIGATRLPEDSAGGPLPVAAAGGTSIAATSETVTPTRTVRPTPSVQSTPERTSEPTPESTVEPTPKPISYAKLTDRQWAKIVKSPDDYVGTGYQVWACITQFDAATGRDAFRGQASNANEEYWFSNGENAYFSGDESRLEDFVTDDLVFMKVTSLGSYSYDTQTGGSTTVPAFHVDAISAKGSCD